MSATAEVSIAGMEPTGRRLKGQVSELVELKNADELIHTAIVYDDAYKGHYALKDNVELAINFMQCPMVAGVVDMSHYDLDQAWYVYPTGTTRTLTEVLKAYRDIGQQCGQRAALEMCYLAGMALLEAGESGPTQGVFSHGDIGPNRVLFDENGQVSIIGHGLPQVELIAWRDDPDLPLREDSFKWAPPERIEGTMEDPTSDMFALTLLAYEMMTGKDLYAGSIDAIREMARKSDGPNLLQKQKKALPQSIREWMEMSLQFDPSVRLTPEDYVSTLYDLLCDEKIKGDPLYETVKRVFGAGKKGRALKSTGETTAIPQRALAPATPGGIVRAPGGGFVAGGRRRAGEDGPAKDDNRWGAVSRAPKRAGEEDEAEEATTGRRGRRRRKRGEEEEEVTTAAAAEEGGRRRRRRRGEDAAAEEPAEEAGARRRRRRRGGDDEEAESEAKVEAKAEEKPEEESPRRRRRRRGADDEEADAKADEPKEESKAKPAPKAAESEPEAKAEESPRRRRRRRGGDDEEPAADDKKADAPAKEPKAEEKPAEEAEESSPRRRRRRRGGDDDEKPAEKAEEKKEDAPEPKARRRRRRKE